MTSGEKLKALRQEKGWRQRELAFACCVGQDTISNWESGKSQMSENAMRRIGKLFDVSWDYFLPTGKDRKIIGNGEKIRMARQKAGLSVVALGEMIGVDPTSVGNWERGKYKCSEENVKKIASVLNVDVSVLVGDVEKKDGSKEMEEVKKEIAAEAHKEELDALKKEIDNLKLELADANDLKEKAYNVAQALKNGAREMKNKCDELEKEIKFLRADKEELHRRLAEEKEKAQSPATDSGELEAAREEIARLKETIVHLAMKGVFNG